MASSAALRRPNCAWARDAIRSGGCAELFGTAARTRSGRHDTSAVAIPTRIASDIARRRGSNAHGLRGMRDGDRSLLGRVSRGTGSEGRPGTRQRPPRADRSGFTGPAPDLSPSSQRLGPWTVPAATAGARSTLRCALGLDDLAACLRALVGTDHVDEPLALARILALARVLRTRASPLALAGVDAATAHLPARLVRGPRDHSAAEQQTRRGARDHHAFSISVHNPSLELLASRANLTATQPDARSGHRCCSDPGPK